MCIVISYLKDILLKKRLFKVYLNEDLLVFNDLCIDELNINAVFTENDFYNDRLEGITTYIKLQKPHTIEYEYYPDFFRFKLKNNERYAIIEYRHAGVYSIKSVHGIQLRELSKIKLFRN